MSIIQSARDNILSHHAGDDPEVLQRAMEHAAIETSLNNLMQFPFIKEQIVAKRLQLHGGFFDIASGKLFSMDENSKEFKPV